MYESFYFRGTGADGMQAFWLKHGMLRYRDSGEVWLEAALVLYAACGPATWPSRGLSMA